jgi:hypothetical protein
MKLVVDNETGSRNFGDGNSKITSSKKKRNSTTNDGVVSVVDVY